MQVLQWIKRALEFVFDPETYCLAWLAVRNHVRAQHSPEAADARAEKKRAKAFNGQ